MSRGVRGASPIVLHCAVGEVVVDFAGMYGPAFAYEIQKKQSPFAARGRPVLDALGGHTTFGARMHERLQRSRHEAVVDEKVFRNAELGVAAFEIACAVIFHSMAQDQVLRTGGCADRVGLHETQLLQSPLQGRWREKRLGNGKAAQGVEVDRHI